MRTVRELCIATRNPNCAQGPPFRGRGSPAQLELREGTVGEGLDIQGRAHPSATTPALPTYWSGPLDTSPDRHPRRPQNEKRELPLTSPLTFIAKAAGVHS